MGGEVIDANPTGCPSVTGLGTVREVMSRPVFLLGNAMGLKNPSYLTFRGLPKLEADGLGKGRHLSGHDPLATGAATAPLRLVPALK